MEPVVKFFAKKSFPHVLDYSLAEMAKAMYLASVSTKSGRTIVKATKQ